MPRPLRFMAVPGGGEQLLDRLSNSPQYVAIRSCEEFASYPGRSKLRLLAISTGDRFTRTAMPTLRESGFDLMVTYCKVVFVSPSALQSQRRVIGQAFEPLLASPA